MRVGAAASLEARGDALLLSSPIPQEGLDETTGHPLYSWRGA